ncbi:MAG: cysteine desulfurase, partial [Gemmatimonadetes bacterium]|nr:cysteine desulfurase [Gemmatimonadota bacterium]
PRAPRAPRAHRPARILRSAVEHKAVMESSRAAEAGGAEVVPIPVDACGVVRLDVLEEELRRSDGRATLVSVMWANNETGVLQPIAELAQLCRAYGAAFHSDAVQAFGKVPVRVDGVPVALLSLSAHKIGGPKGIGALYLREGLTIEPIVFGGGQESGLRSGTQAVALAVGFAKAADLAVAALDEEARRLGALRDRLEAELLRRVADVQVNAAAAPRVPNILNISVAGVAIDTLLMALDLEGIAVSSGSACTTGSVEASHVIVAMGREGAWAENTIRFSLGWGTQEWEIERALEVFPRVVSRVREFAAAQGA